MTHRDKFEDHSCILLFNLPLSMSYISMSIYLIVFMWGLSIWYIHFSGRGLSNFRAPAKLLPYGRFPTGLQLSLFSMCVVLMSLSFSFQGVNLSTCGVKKFRKKNYQKFWGNGKFWWEKIWKRKIKKKWKFLKKILLHPNKKSSVKIFFRQNT